MTQHRVGLAQRFHNVSQFGALAVRAFAREAWIPRRRAAGTRGAAGRADGSSPASPSIASKIPSKSARCMGSSLASARRRPVSSRATIISRIAVMRSPSKNMCSVRQSPMPSAPNAARCARRAACRHSRERAGVGRRRPKPSSARKPDTPAHSFAFACRESPARLRLASSADRRDRRVRSRRRR